VLPVCDLSAALFPPAPIVHNTLSHGAPRHVHGSTPDWAHEASPLQQAVICIATLGGMATYLLGIQPPRVLLQYLQQVPLHILKHQVLHTPVMPSSVMARVAQPTQSHNARGLHKQQQSASHNVMSVYGSGDRCLPVSASV
jgi:hypothetical protein